MKDSKQCAGCLKTDITGIIILAVLTVIIIGYVYYTNAITTAEDAFPYLPQSIEDAPNS